jgi:hypothetical protein
VGPDWKPGAPDPHPGSRLPAEWRIIPSTRTESDVMTDPKLQRVVEEIRSQLASAESLPPGTRRSLEQLVRDLESLPSPAGAPAESIASLRDRTTDAIRRLEASHPVLSTTLGNVVDALAFFGL